MMSSKHSFGYLEQIPNFKQGVTLLDAVMEMFADIFAMRDQMRHLEKDMGNVTGTVLEDLLGKRP